MGKYLYASTSYHTELQWLRRQSHQAWPERCREVYKRIFSAHSHLLWREWRKLALSAPLLLPGSPDWMKPGRLASLIIYLKEIAYDKNLEPPSALYPFY